MKSFPLFLLIFSLFFNLSATDPAKVAYLGVHTEKLSPGTSHQLNLPIGAYLEVVYVGKESPALEAGIQSYDVLKKFDDQILINQEQLKQLVQMKQPGDSVILQLLRKGKELNLSIELGETTVSPNRSRRSPLDPFGRSSLFEDNFLNNSGRIRDLFEKEFGNQFGFRNRPFDPSAPDFSIPRSPRSKGFDPNSPVHQPEDDVQSFTYSSTQNQMTVTDEMGTLHYTEKDGEKFLRATDPQGELIFEGPVNSPEERKNLPKGLLPRLKKIEKN